MVPGASLPSWRKPGRGGGIPGGMSASESGLGRPFLGPWRWGRTCLWLGAQAGLLICIYLHVCKFHLLTLAGLGKTPVQKARQDPTPRGWLPAGTSTQNLGPCFIDQSNASKSLNPTQGFSPGFPSCPGQELQLPRPSPNPSLASRTVTKPTWGLSMSHFSLGSLPLCCLCHHAPGGLPSSLNT